MRSLFIVSLPRSFSSATFGIAQQVLGLHAPRWTSNGEVLNIDQHILQAPGIETSVKFVTRESDPVRFERALALLDDLIRSEDHVYKDVTQPFVVAEWLTAADIGVLKIRRDVAEVAVAMLNRNWRYPAHAAPPGSDNDEAVIRGLLRADATLERLAGRTVEYERIVEDESALADALTDLYPEIALPRFRYITDEFRARREEIASRRVSDGYRRIADLVEIERARLKSSK